MEGMDGKNAVRLGQECLPQSVFVVACCTPRLPATYHRFVRVLLELHQPDARNVLQLTGIAVVNFIVSSVQVGCDRWWCYSERFFAVYFPSYHVMRV